MKNKELLSSTVNFRPLSWDIPNDRKSLYAGIYNITINNKLVITIIPKWGANENISKVKIPLEFDSISTPEEAKNIALFTSNIAITENNLLAGKAIELMPDEIENKQKITIFYINKNKFNIFENEIKKILDTPENPNKSSTQIKELEKYDIVSYLIEVLEIYNSYKPKQT